MTSAGATGSGLTGSSLTGTGLSEEPLLSVTLGASRKAYSAGDELLCEYQIDAIDSSDIQAVEASVIWITEGKGEEDLGVHFFERRLPGDADDGDLRPMRRFKVILPNSPLSYDGAIVRIRWCVRLRLFARRGREFVLEQPFTLGAVPAAPVTARTNGDATDGDE